MASISAATSGLWSATSTWTGAIVPIVGDKVTIGHPGSNRIDNGVAYITNTAGYAIGATVITLITGTGSIIAGESVQFAGDGNYYKVTVGIAAPGAITIAAPGLIQAIPASATAVVNRGYTVEIDGTYTAGDDTSSTTATANGFVVSGTINFSRTVNSSLTARGSICMATGSTFDMGSTLLPIPAGVTATLILNNSATLAPGKHGFHNAGNTGTTYRLVGKTMTRNTTMNSTLAGATSITVAASTNWAIGDRLVIASDTDDGSRAQIVTISGGSTPTWTVSAITNARASGTRVGNLSSNVTVKPFSGANPSFMTSNPAATSTTGEITITDVRFEDMGSTLSWVGISVNPIYQGGLNLVGPSMPKYNVTRPAFETLTTTPSKMISLGTASINRHSVSDFAIHQLNSSTYAIQFHSGASMDIDGVGYRLGSTGITSSNSDGSAGSTISGEFWSTNTLLNWIPSVNMTFNNAILHAPGQLSLAGNGTVTFNGGTISTVGALSLASSPGTASTVTYIGTTFLGNSLTASLTSGSIPSQSWVNKLIAVAGVASDNRVRSYYQTSDTDTGTKKNGSYSIKMSNRVANTATQYVFTIPAVAGVAQVVKGNFRFDTNYGTATPPSITLSGQGVSTSATSPAVANTWAPFTLSFTPTTSGDITCTVVFQSTVTTGFAWLDGLYHYPMIQSTKWYGYQYNEAAALTVDPVVQVSEATAAAYTGLAYSAGTLTVSGTRSIREIYDWLKWYETTNQVSAIITSTDGTNFTLAANLTISGAITGTGTINMPTFTLSNSGFSSVVIISTAGTTVPLTVTGLTGTNTVQVYNVATATELSNASVAATSISVNVLWTTNQTIRLRVAQTGYLPFTLSNTLTNAGVSFTVSQTVDTVYNSNGITGSTVTECSADYPNTQIDINTGAGTTTVPRLYAWIQYIQTTANGIRNFFGAMVASDTANYSIVVGSVDLKLDNTNAAPLVVSGGYLSRSDGTTVIASTSNSIQLDAGRAFVASGDPVAFWNTQTSAIGGTGTIANVIKNNVPLIPGLF